jgi:hypothetical protein
LSEGEKRDTSADISLDSKVYLEGGSALTLRPPPPLDWVTPAPTYPLETKLNVGDEGFIFWGNTEMQDKCWRLLPVVCSFQHCKISTKNQEKFTQDTTIPFKLEWETKIHCYGWKVGSGVGSSPYN